MSKYSHEDWHLITLSCYFSSFRWGRVELDTEGVLWSYPISDPHITLELGPEAQGWGGGDRNGMWEMSEVG